MEEIGIISGIVHSFGVLTEYRDPYTAGHQKRVANIACKIGKDLGLSYSHLLSLRIASLLHDIGKVVIPIEILSKPGKISVAEWSIIKEHVCIGRHILKSIYFPWPIARIVSQHHEKINGTGYPNGLSGDRLLFCSKILTVADVVEAMTANRSYRLSLGIDATVKEITINRGILYDEDVVDSCLKTVFNKEEEESAEVIRLY